MIAVKKLSCLVQFFQIFIHEIRQEKRI